MSEQNSVPPISSTTQIEDIEFAQYRMKDIEAQIAGTDTTEKPSLSTWDYLRVTKEKNIPNPPPTATISGAGIASPGNITGISALPKAGKTAVTGIIAAAAISEDGTAEGFAELTVRANPDKKAVVVIDTEQAEADQQYNVNTTLRRAGYDTTPEHFRAYNIRQLTLADYKPTTAAIIEACANHCGGIHSIIIDGGADFTLSVNDEAEANEVVQYFIHLAIKYACPVWVVIHLNPGIAGKERGHFGSAIQRKCYGLLTIEKVGDVSCLSCKMARKAGDGDILPIYYKYNKESGYHTEAGSPDPEGKKADTERQRTKSCIDAAFKPLQSYRYTDAVKCLMQSTGKAERTCKTMITNADGWGFFTKGDDNLYRLHSG